MHYFNTKSETEEVVLSFDFTDHLAAGDTIAAIRSVDRQVWNGNDPYVQGLVGVVAIAAGALAVTVQAQAGVNGNDYLITVKATSTNGEKLELAGLLPVRRAT